MEKDIRLEALKASIRKWQSILRGSSYDFGISGCELCTRFRYASSTDCEACPVKQASGRANCANTPYANWYKHQSIYHDRHKFPKFIWLGCNECEQIVLSEIAYLKSLLPKRIKNEKKK